MIKEVREEYNRLFTEKKYEIFLQDLSDSIHHRIPFRVAESPLFVDRKFKGRLLEASNDIINFLVSDAARKSAPDALPAHLKVPGETAHPLFLALDFAIVKDNTGELVPRLIEMQGFPSLFGWQDFLASKFREHFYVPSDFKNHFVSDSNYHTKLKHAILGNENPENVILLEIDPMKQNTVVDFLMTEQITSVKPVHIGDVIKEGRKLFYNREGKKVPITRIYNRVIFDELIKRTDLDLSFTLTDEVDVQWAGHPNWFFKISKYTMPFIKSEYVPECKFLSDYDSLPADLENYVLKPLYSFSGSGIIFHVTSQDIKAIPKEDRKDFILQRKVEYEPVIHAPDGMVKTEVRLMFIWEENSARPELVTNLARLSRGEMIGVKYNKDKTWVGGSVCFFEP